MSEDLLLSLILPFSECAGIPLLPLLQASITAGIATSLLGYIFLFDARNVARAEVESSPDVAEKAAKGYAHHHEESGPFRALLERSNPPDAVVRLNSAPGSEFNVLPAIFAFATHLCWAILR